MEDFEPHTKKVTIVKRLNGEEITRLDGFVTINPKDFEEHLPIEYIHIKLTSETVSVIKVEK